MKKQAFLLPIAALTLTLAACGSDNADSGASAEEKEEMTLTHELGETTFDKNPENVVVFDFGTLDTLDALDVEVTGIPKGGTVPSYLSAYESDDYENVGSLKEPDFEAINAMGPDLIIISGRQAEMYDELSEIAPTIYMGVDTSNYMESFEENVTTLGEIFEKEEKAAEKLEAVHTSIDELNEKVTAEDRNALIILANDGKISAYGAGSRFGLIHDIFGFTPVDESIDVSTHGQSISYEYIVENDPEYIFVVDRGAVVGGESSAKQVVENELVEKTKAYQDGNIVYLNPDFWYLSGGGLVSVQEMVNEIASEL
ncbi:siderophore ABC transporter substrate-binding protein [Jeotgalibacillus proteolyticus]|uniref:ABC transporter n=1 Tax=Jeotgalibacillus proteolyticus TaxID=2082395 RepID=A0A2S5GD20_9BACL|nr:siderophore ABC transporter substrate-binding protein [Jeotgalibacillus proteolyticus]PPA70900.1 ABC transporter [Jeotgalibacillus proteolyticus]